MLKKIYRIIKWFDKTFVNNFGLIVNIFILFTTFWIWFEANTISRSQNSISEKQTKILESQTKILATQTNIQKEQLDFEKEKNWSDTAKDYREKMNQLFDKILTSDEILVDVHKKIKDSNKVENQDNLDRYVSEFEDIWELFCDWKIKLADLKWVLWKQLRYTCWNSQIYGYYKSSKSGLSWMCKILFPSSTGMAKYANSSRCPVIK